MPKVKKHHIIACAVVGPELKRIINKQNLNVSIELFEGGLHEDPRKLRNKLQEAIDEISDSGFCQRISIGYGICGHGTSGVNSRNLNLAFPRVHDCIALFLGSDKAYKKEFNKFPGTFYITEGWYTEKIQPGSVKQKSSIKELKEIAFQDLKNKYGTENAKEIQDFFSSWQKNYQRSVFIDTGSEVKKRYLQLAKDMAKEFNWKYQSLKGNTRLLNLLLTTEETTDEILIVPPKSKTIYDATPGKLSSKPESTQLEQNKAISSYKKNRLSDVKLQNWNIKYGLGVDAGGTYTDIVIFDLKTDTVLDSNKALTTKFDYTIGIKNSLAGLDQTLLQKVELVSLSTTLATNAIVEGKGEKVGLFIMTPYGIFNSTDIDHEPKAVISAQMDMDGSEIAPVIKKEVIQAAKRMMGVGVKAFAVSGYASVRNSEHELRVKEIITNETGYPVTCGHELSGLLNYFTRANTAVYNAMIIHHIKQLLTGLERVLQSFSIRAPIVVVKGDGTLMSAEMTKLRPVETILSGPAASAAGALHMTTKRDAVIVDMGGTTTDCAVLEDGLVRICENGSLVGSFRTHVKALDIRTSGLGGDSTIVRKGGEFFIGPKRVAPMAYLSFVNSNFEKTIQYLENRIDYYKYTTYPMQVLTIIDPDYIPETEQEEHIIKILKEYPHSLDELSDKIPLNLWSSALQKMMIKNIVQRFNLTPTDLLHARGDFTRWDIKTSIRICNIFAELAQIKTDELISFLLEKITDTITKELIKQQLAETSDPDKIESCDTCKVFLDNILGKNNEKFDLKYTLNKPIIGIGAPVHYFLHEVGKKLNTEVIVPEFAAVGNAIGAITSRVVIKKELKIVPTVDGTFVVEGLKSDEPFDTISEAQVYLEHNLVKSILDLARQYGTSETEILFDVHDSIVKSQYDDGEVFLSRAVSAKLVGVPDLVVQ